MKENVRIRISGTQESLGDDSIEMITTGEYKEKDGKIYLSYWDRMLEEDKAIKTLIKTDGKLVSIIRYGDRKNHLLFESGISHISPYETPFGNLEMTSYTDKIELTPLEGGFDLKVDYQLEINKSGVGRNQLHVTATPLKNAVNQAEAE